MLLQQIITNEFNHQLHRQSAVSESRELFLCVSDCVGEYDTLLDVKNIIHDYIADNYICCDACGECHPRNTIDEIWTGTGFNRVCANPDCHNAMRAANGELLDVNKGGQTDEHNKAII